MSNSVLERRQEEDVEEALEETIVPWTDAKIRWSDDDDDSDDSDDSAGDSDEDDSNGNGFFFEDPRETFSYRFPLEQLPRSSDDAGNAVGDGNNKETGASAEPATPPYVDVELEGYKMESPQVWNSTGLTVWRASKVLCEHLLTMTQQQQKQRKQSQPLPTRILELGSGLGLVGIMVYRMMTVMAVTSDHNAAGRKTNVCLTDGDTDALKQLRRNVERNKVKRQRSDAEGDHRISSHQLLWGRETAEQFLHRQHRRLQRNDGNQEITTAKFDLILASDVVYAPSVIEPLFETVQVLLSKQQEHSQHNEPATAAAASKFVMAFVDGRKVPVTKEHVLRVASDAGFAHECVYRDCKENPDDKGVLIYEFRWKTEGSNSNNN